MLHGKVDIRCDTFFDPKIEDSRDIIIKVTSCAICGSDLHLMDGQMPTMEAIAGVISMLQEKLTSTERPYVLTEAMKAVRPCGVVSILGVYGGPLPVNMGQVVQKGLTIRSGQTHVKRYLEPLTKLIQEGRFDMTSMITHRSTNLADGPGLYDAFRDKKDGCVKVVFHPN